MDFGTIIGIIGGTALIVWAILLGGPLSLFWDTPSVLIVGGGTLSAIFISYPTKDILGLAKITLKAFSFKIPKGSDIVLLLGGFATTIKKEGTVKLLTHAKNKGISHELLLKGLQLLAENQPDDKIKKILTMETNLVQKKHAIGREILLAMAKYTPAFGMIGTLIGLVQMLINLSDPAAIGPSMSVAILTTFYGAFCAFVIFSPLATKLKRRSEQELLFAQMVIEGVLMLHARESSLMIEDRLINFLNADELKAFYAAKGVKPETPAK